jgi:hypothetical protein
MTETSTVLMIFVVAFFSLSVLSLGYSIFRGNDAEVSKNCRGASWMGFFIGLILLYLRFVLI